MNARIIIGLSSSLLGALFFLSCVEEGDDDARICGDYISTVQDCASLSLGAGDISGISGCLFGLATQPPNEQSEQWQEALNIGCELFAYKNYPSSFVEQPCQEELSTFGELKGACLARALGYADVPYPECLGDDFSAYPGPPDDARLALSLAENCDM